MIADGELDAETVQHGGRVVTRVRLPQIPAGDAGALPRSRTAQLQEQVDRLTKTLERLTTLLQEANRDRAALQAALRRHEGAASAGAREAAPAPPFTAEPAQPSAPPRFGRILGGLRPNPMTHPASELPRSRPMRREELLEPVRELFRTRRRAWWQRISLLSRG
jgi:Tfp pilus assembly protein FimV